MGQRRNISGEKGLDFKITGIQVAGGKFVYTAVSEPVGKGGTLSNSIQIVSAEKLPVEIGQSLSADLYKISE